MIHDLPITSLLISVDETDFWMENILTPYIELMSILVLYKNKSFTIVNGCSDYLRVYIHQELIEIL